MKSRIIKWFWPNGNIRLVLYFKEKQDYPYDLRNFYEDGTEFNFKKEFINGNLNREKFLEDYYLTEKTLYISNYLNNPPTEPNIFELDRNDIIIRQVGGKK